MNVKNNQITTREIQPISMDKSISAADISISGNSLESSDRLREAFSMENGEEIQNSGGSSLESDTTTTD